MNKREARIYDNKMRRIHERRRNVILLITTICLVILLSVTINGFLSKAKSKTEDIQYKYYKSIIVNSGDTLWTIANEYKGTGYKSADEYIIEVKQMNGLKDDSITAGNYLIIPYFSNQFVG